MKSGALVSSPNLYPPCPRDFISREGTATWRREFSRENFELCDVTWKHSILCVLIVILNLLSLAAEILIPSICGPSMDRCLTQRSGVTNNSEPYRPYNTTIYEITLAFAAWNALSHTVTFILLIYTLWQVYQRIVLEKMILYVLDILLTISHLLIFPRFIFLYVVYI